MLLIYWFFYSKTAAGPFMCALKVFLISVAFFFFFFEDEMNDLPPTFVYT